MMQVQELRIGNLVKYNSIIVKVDSIISPKPLNDVKFSDKYIIELFDGASTITATIDDIEPILISSDYLVKLGFNLSMSHGKYSNWIIDFSTESNYLSFNNIIIKYCRYVHEIQNIFLELKSEPLNFRQ